jgi:hypothetical protein
MTKQETSFADIVVQYDALMQRYARFIIRNGIDTSGIVKEAFETYYGKYAGTTPAKARQLLRSEVLYACTYCMRWLRYQHKNQL